MSQHDFADEDRPAILSLAPGESMTAMLAIPMRERRDATGHVVVVTGTVIVVVGGGGGGVVVVVVVGGGAGVPTKI